MGVRIPNIIEKVERVKHNTGITIIIAKVPMAPLKK